MTKEAAKQINRLIIKFISFLEEDISELNGGSLKIKKDIFSILGRLTSLMVQLNKLKNNPGPVDLKKISKKDLEIIENFIEKYR